MPATTGFDQHTLFLALCLSRCERSKINFEAVGATCGLTKAQAYKRLWDIMKKVETAKKNAENGASPASLPNGEHSEQLDNNKTAAEKPKGSSKKRKIKQKEIEDFEESANHATEQTTEQTADQTTE